MTVTLNINVDDLVPQRVLSEQAARAADMSPLMDNIGALIEQTTRDRISETNVAPDGTPWPQSMRAQEEGGPTLFDTGRLAASITHIADRNSAEIGSNLIYAGIHQTGGEILPKNADTLQFRLPNGAFVSVGKVTIPARPYLGLSSDDVDDIEGLVEDYFGAVQ